MLLVWGSHFANQRPRQLLADGKCTVGALDAWIHEWRGGRFSFIWPWETGGGKGDCLSVPSASLGWGESEIFTESTWKAAAPLLPHLCWSWHCLFLSPEAVGEAGSGLPSYGNRRDQTSVSLLAVSGQKQLKLCISYSRESCKAGFLFSFTGTGL